MSEVRDLEDSDFPVGSIVVVDSHDSLDLSWGSSGEGGGLDLSGDDRLELEGLEDVPCLSDGEGKDS